MKKLELDLQPIEAQIVEFLKTDKKIDADINADTKRKGMTVDEEWVKELLWRCADIHWVAMDEYETRANPEKGKAELADIDLKLSKWVAENYKKFYSQWNIRKRGASGANMHPPGGPPTTPLHDVYREVWSSWDEAGFKKFSPNTNSKRYGHDHNRPDRHEYWNPAARLLLKIVLWLGYREPNVRGLIDTMNEKRKASRRNTPPIRS
jgi:hypothetical protein